MLKLLSLVALTTLVLLSCATTQVLAADTSHNSSKLDGSQVTALYHKIHKSLLGGDWTTFESLFESNAEIYIQGFGLGANVECSPVSVKFVFDSINTYYNTTRAIDTQQLAAYNTIHAQTIFVGLVADLNQPPIVTTVMKVMRCNANCTKIVYWHDIADLTTTPKAQDQRRALSILLSGWSTRNADAFSSAFAKNVSYGFWYQGSTQPAAFSNYSGFAGYASAVFPTQTSAQAMVPIIQVAGGCNYIASRSIITQSSLNGQGPASVQDNIVFYRVEDEAPYRVVEAMQVLQRP